ncbi:CRISPR-associated endoribonuclease Cas6 [Tuberibacillus calidus]|uniref:CRISPR-associated endoribonuclease Cas6 n=1 Tax=Tuberibacillus calidus TaxID=340097 RepID=UPI00042A32F7|nr:CRISPR-associated endoribonuclease Cas6 [Tuberibacillus calidus]
MRVLLEFSMQSMPVAYRLGILSIIKEMIRLGSEDYYHNLFELNQNKMKPFAFSTYFTNMSIQGDMIFGDGFSVTVSSSSYELMMHLMNGSQRKKVYKYKDKEWVLLHKRLLPNPPSFSSEVTFKTLSPLLIENKEKRPVLADDGAFESEFNYYAEMQVRELAQRSLYQPIQILWNAMKKQVVKEYLHQEQNTPLYFTTNTGLIKLRGHSEDLKIIYDVGIGKRSSMGFGLLDVEEVAYT